MLPRIRLQVRRVAQDANEDVLCADVEIEAAGDCQADEANAVRDDLDRWTSGAERGRGDVLATPAVDDQREAEVGGNDDAHADVQSLLVVARFAHLANYRKEGGGAGVGDVDAAGCYHSCGECRVGNGMESKVV